MKNLCRASFFALCCSGLLSVATPALAVSGGASCEDTGSSGYGYGPGRFGPLPPRHERRAPRAWAWSPAPRRSWAGPGLERPGWTRPEWTRPGVERPERPERTRPTLEQPDRMGHPYAGRSRWNRPPTPEFDRPAPQRPTRADWTRERLSSRSLAMEPPARPERAAPARPAFDYPERLRAWGPMRPRSPLFAPTGMGTYRGNGNYHARGLMAPPPPFFQPSRPWTDPLQAAPGATGEVAPATQAAASPGPEETLVVPAGSKEAEPGVEAEAVVAAAPASDTDGDGAADATDFCPGTAAGTPVDAFGCAATETIVLRGVNFHTDSAQLTDESNATLASVAKTLIAHPEIHVEIAGHTDSDGDAEHNFDLSSRRAIMVMKQLADAGVSPDNMIARGYGADRPIAPNDTPEDKAANRRVELSPLD